MPAGIAVSTWYYGIMKIKSNVDAWTEIYPFKPAGTLLEAQKSLGQLLADRSALLSSDCVVSELHVSQKGGARDKWPALTDTSPPLRIPDDYFDGVLVGSEIAIEGSNTTGDGVTYRFETGTGQYDTKAIKGVRDSWIVRNIFNVDPGAPYPVGGPYLAVGEVTPATAEGLVLANFLSYYRDHCAMYQFDSGAGNYKSFTFSSYWFRQVTRRKVGGKGMFGKGRQSSYS